MNEGYYAFDGVILGASVEKVRLFVMVNLNQSDGKFYAYRFGGYPHKVDLMIGTWTRIYMPWEESKMQPIWIDGIAYVPMPKERKDAVIGAVNALEYHQNEGGGRYEDILPILHAIFNDSLSYRPDDNESDATAQAG